MKSKFIKVGVLCFLGLGATVYGQTSGRVGINTVVPNATLEIQPNADNLVETSTTNEGLIIPKLSKKRVDAITSPVEGTKVYVTDEVLASDVKFIGTGKGFYYYNGTKWAKQLDAEKEGEWIYTNNRVNLKRSGVAPFLNKVYYDTATEQFVNTSSEDKVRLV